MSDTRSPDEARRLHWEAPESWEASSRDVPMRLATYYVGSDEGEVHGRLEVAVSAFPGEVGGALANVNRWRDQLGLEPVTQSELDAHLSSFGDPDDVHGWTLRIDADTNARAEDDAEPHVQAVADTSGPDGMLAAIIHSPRHDYTWFVRALGQTGQLDAHESEVRAFAETFHVAEERDDDGHSHDHGHAHPHGYDHSHDHDTDQRHQLHPHAQIEHDRHGELALKKPADWRVIERSSSIVYASFEAGPPERPASVAVTPLAGDAGGLFANVNMWRQQLGLPGLEDRDEQPTEAIDVDGRSGTLVAVEGDVASLLAVVVPDGDRTWFFRMSGPTALIVEQREAFERFVRTARFREP